MTVQASGVRCGAVQCCSGAAQAAALTVAGSQVATAVTATYDLALDQAAVIAEFDGDAEAVKALTVAAVEDPAQLAHVGEAPVPRASGGVSLPMVGTM